jgi:2-polyprenyl-3-methyl-5-hydroxy-6-metoxy-1,4-benzoquinol methylase
MSNSNVKCPVCGSLEYDRLFPEYQGKALSSDWYLHENIKIFNSCCKGCGLIYEAEGVRHFSFEFYDKVFKPKPMMKVFGKTDAISRQDKAFHLLRESVSIPDKGSLLEAGSGMGGFSKLFAEEYKNWDVHSFEPSASFDHLSEKAKNLPNLHIERKGYSDVKITPASKDFIVSLGVLEHVGNPDDMLRWASEGLKEGGYLFIEIPNFENQPNDLLCVDHLSKLTIYTVESLASKNSLKVLKTIKQGVPLYVLMQKVSSSSKALVNCYDQNIAIARSNEAILKKTMEVLNEARNNARKNDEVFGIFGLATAGLMAPFYLNFDPSEIGAFIDENQALWNTRIFDREVGGLDLITKKNIKHIALAISPAYIEQVKQKLSNFDVKLYSA